MPDATITSTASTFGTISGTFAADQSTVAGTVYAITGTVNGSVGVPGPQGPAGSQGPQGDPGSPGAPGQGVAAGGSTGQVLQKLSATSYDTGWLTLGTMAAQTAADYSTTAQAAALYYPLTGNPSAFITASALTPYLLKAGGYITGDIQSSNGSGYRSWNGTNLTGILTAASVVFNDTTAGHGSLTVDADGITFYSSPYKQTQPFLGLAGYATEGWVTAGFYPLTGNPSAFITASALTPYLTSATAAATYQTLAGMSSYLTSSTAASTYATIAAGQPISGTVGQVLTKNSGANWDSSWATLIPGDRYLTSSTTSLSVTNGAKTLTVGTGLSYSPQQDIVIAYDATAHMHAVVTSYNSGTGVLVCNVTNHTGTGTFALWTVNVGGTTPLQSIYWGEILGTLGDQSDLATALNAKLEITDAASTYYLQTNPDGFITQTAADDLYYSIYNPSGFISQGTADGLYYSISNPDGFLQSTTAASTYQTQSAMSAYATLAGSTFTGLVQVKASGGGGAGLLIPLGAAPSSPLDGEIWNAGSAGLKIQLASVTQTLANQSWVTSQGYLTSAPVTSVAGRTGAITLANTDISGLGTMSTATAADYSTTTVANGLYYPLSGNPSSFLVAADITGKANLSGATFTGLVTTAASTTASAGLNVPHGVAPTTLVNGDIWTTTGGLFARINASTNQFAALSTNNTFSNASSTYGSSTATGTIGLATGATISASTKTVNVATGGVSGSTTLTTVGPVLGASTTSIGGTTAASTLNLATGATLTATVKAVNIATNAVAGATTTVVIGSTTGTSTTTLQGITNGITAAVDTNSVALATTAFVIGQAGSATPIVDGTAAVGTSLRYARQDHVHPTDTSRAALASPSLTGTPLSTTAAADTNSTQIATTAYVVGQAASTAPAATGTAAVGTSLKYARADHVHVNPLPVGGTTSQVLSKVDGTNYNVAWTTVASGSGVWGAITGTLSSQTDLQSALDAKLSTATAATTYYPLTGNPSGFLTTAPVTSVAGRTGAITLANTDISGLGTMSTATAADYSTTTAANALYYPLSGNPSSFLVAADIAGKANLASPSLSGTPLSTTAAVDTNTTQIATTAFVVAQAASATPLIDGTAAVGTSTRYARADHVHPVDTSRAPLASPSLSGTPLAPTAALTVNTTQIATTAFVQGLVKVKAWVNFNGTGTVAIRASYNVTSITDNGVGNYTVNFTTAMADVNFATVGSASNDASSAMGFQPTTRAVGSVVVLTRDTSGGGQVDLSAVSVACFR